MSQPLKNRTQLTRVCPFCKTSGECGKCHGSGEVVTVLKRRFKRTRQQVECRACDGTGVCQLCHGKGRLYSRVSRTS